MSSRTPRPSLAARLAATADAYQREAVIPHCPSCSKPCCKLDVLVIELDWPQVKGLWKLKESRTAFDRRLASGRGPIEIRPANGLYYAHSRPCPAWNPAAGCGVYDSALKPPGCSDFPVYEDRGDVIADLRCEAVALPVLKETLARALGPGYRITESADRDFPFLVTLGVRR